MDFCFRSCGLTDCEERSSTRPEPSKNGPRKNSGWPSCLQKGERGRPLEEGSADRDWTTGDFGGGATLICVHYTYSVMRPQDVSLPISSKCHLHRMPVNRRRPIDTPVENKKELFITKCLGLLKYSNICNAFGGRNSCWWLKGHVVQPSLGMLPCSNRMPMKMEFSLLHGCQICV